MHEGVPLYVELPTSVELVITLHRAGPAGRPLDRRHEAGDARDRRRRSRCRCSSPPARRSRSTPATAATSAASMAAGQRMAARARKARKRALDVLYEADLRATRPVHDARRAGSRCATRRCNDYTVELVEGVAAHLERIDEILASYAEGWTLERMPVVDRDLLRLGVYELLWRDDVPDRGGDRRGGRAGQVAVDRRVAAVRQRRAGRRVLRDQPTMTHGNLGVRARRRGSTRVGREHLPADAAVSVESPRPWCRTSSRASAGPRRGSRAAAAVVAALPLDRRCEPHERPGLLGRDGLQASRFSTILDKPGPVATCGCSSAAVRRPARRRNRRVRRVAGRKRRGRRARRSRRRRPSSGRRTSLDPVQRKVLLLRE